MIAYNLKVWISPDYEVYVPSLPGCVSQGESIEDCLINIKDAFDGVIEVYKEDNLEIPFCDAGEKPPFYEEKEIFVIV